MKTYTNLFDSIVSLDNLTAAYRAARRGKRTKPQAALFEFEAEKNILNLSKKLGLGTYLPGRYRLFLIREPKRRIIAAAPFQDRVVHHAWCRIVMPLLIRSFIDDTYACLPGRGTHRAVLRHIEFMRRYAYRCHLDVRAFFPSITIDLLMELVSKKIRDKRALALLSRILESGLCVYQNEKAMKYIGIQPYGPQIRRGLPIGNLTSQHLANVYLNELDHLIKRTLKVRGYLRYMDDMVLFGNDPQELKEQAAQVVEYLDTQRLLAIKQPPRVINTLQPVVFLGQIATRRGLSLSSRTLTKIRRQARALRTADSVRVERSLMSWRGLVW